MRRQRIEELRRLHRTGGFTLIELMIAIAVVGVISVVIYQLFDVTSQNFREVDQLADLNDRVRFASEMVRNQVQAAGAQGTPDSALDSWVEPQVAGSRVVGLLPYAGWQDNTAQLPARIREANPNVSFDGIVVVGAFDFPLSFEFAGLAPGSPRLGRIYANQRGIMKLNGQDLFASGLNQPAQPANPTLQGALAGTTGVDNNWTARLLRVSDRQGFQQFIQPRDLQVDGDLEFYTVEVPADGTIFGPKFKAAGDGFFGLDDLPEGDTGYDAGLLDAYWIHVVPDSANPNVMSLVRDRLCASQVASNFVGFNPSAALASTCDGVDERTVLASNIADFQVWFDCADPADGAVRNADWSYTWSPNDHSTAGDCMDENAPQPGLVRAAHIRIAMHTRSERSDQRHIQFEDAAGAVCNPDDNICDPTRVDAATLRTYDFFPDSVGAAQVVVMQTDFEMVNFVNRNPLPPTP